MSVVGCRDLVCAGLLGLPQHVHGGTGGEPCLSVCCGLAGLGCTGWLGLAQQAELLLEALSLHRPFGFGLSPALLLFFLQRGPPSPLFPLTRHARAFSGDSVGCSDKAALSSFSPDASMPTSGWLFSQASCGSEDCSPASLHEYSIASFCLPSVVATSWKLVLKTTHERNLDAAAEQSC